MSNSSICSLYDDDSFDYRELDWVFLWNLEAIQWFLLHKDKVKPQTFTEHLTQASETVATWPEWKQTILGGNSMNNSNKYEISAINVKNNIEAVYVIFDRKIATKTVLVGSIYDFHCYLDLDESNNPIAIEIKTRDNEIEYNERNEKQKEAYMQMSHLFANEVKSHLYLDSRQLLNMYKKHENSIM